jgi:GT2 family glycosyltransferase
VDTVAFGAYRSSVFEEIGYFDEELVRNQDDEFNFRITKNGGKIWFDPAIRSNYYVRSSYKKLFRQYLQYGYWKVYVNVKHATVTTGRQLVPAIFVLMLLVLLAGGLVFPLFRVASLWLLMVWFFAALAAVFFNHTRSAMIGGTLLTFFILHFSYGWGYLEGLLRFAILRKSPKSKKLQSTR